MANKPCRRGHELCDMLEMLINAGGLKNDDKNANNRSCLHLAVDARSLCHVRKLISMKVAVNGNGTGNVTESVLGYALRMGVQSNIIAVLLDAGAVYHPCKSVDVVFAIIAGVCHYFIF